MTTDLTSPPEATPVPTRAVVAFGVAATGTLTVTAVLTFGLQLGIAAAHEDGPLGWGDQWLTWLLVTLRSVCISALAWTAMVFASGLTRSPLVRIGVAFVIALITEAVQVFVWQSALLDATAGTGGATGPLPELSASRVEELLRSLISVRFCCGIVTSTLSLTLLAWLWRHWSAGLVMVIPGLTTNLASVGITLATTDLGDFAPRYVSSAVCPSITHAGVIAVLLPLAVHLVSTGMERLGLAGPESPWAGD